MILISPFFRKVTHGFASKASGSVRMEAASRISGDATAPETAWTDRMKWTVLVCLKRLQSFLSPSPTSELNLSHPLWFFFRLKGKAQRNHFSFSCLWCLPQAFLNAPGASSPAWAPPVVSTHRPAVMGRRSVPLARTKTTVSALTAV